MSASLLWKKTDEDVTHERGDATQMKTNNTSNGFVGNAGRFSARMDAHIARKSARHGMERFHIILVLNIIVLRVWLSDGFVGGSLRPDGVLAPARATFKLIHQIHLSTLSSSNAMCFPLPSD